MAGISGSLRAVMVAAAILIMAVAGSAWHRQGRLRAASDDLSKRQTELYRQAFPGRRISASPIREIRSEYNRALGSRRSVAIGSIDTDAAPPASATATLRRVIAAMPELRFQIQRLEVAGSQLQMTLKSKTADDVFRFADALGVSGFAVEPPATDQTGDGFYTATIVAGWIGEGPAS